MEQTNTTSPRPPFGPITFPTVRVAMVSTWYMCFWCAHARTQLAEDTKRRTERMHPFVWVTICCSHEPCTAKGPRHHITETSLDRDGTSTSERHASSTWTSWSLCSGTEQAPASGMPRRHGPFRMPDHVSDQKFKACIPNHD